MRDVRYTAIPVLTRMTSDASYTRCPVPEDYLINQHCNVFVLDQTPRRCAEALSDRDLASRSRWYPTILLNAHARVATTKISTAHWKDHPWVVWAALCGHNYRWLLALTDDVWEAYELRFRHPCAFANYIPRVDLRLPWNIPDRDGADWDHATVPPVVLPFRNQPVTHTPTWPVVIEAYRDWYIESRGHRPTHTHTRGWPQWYTEKMQWLDAEDAAAMGRPEPVMRQIRTIA
jgi:hypothetical protein